MEINRSKQFFLKKIPLLSMALSLLSAGILSVSVNAAVPTAPPGGLWVSSDKANNTVGWYKGTLKVFRANNEDSVEGYRFYFGTGSAKISEITSVTKETTATLSSISTSVPFTEIPQGATHVHVYTYSGADENPTPVIKPFTDKSDMFEIVDHFSVDTILGSAFVPKNNANEVIIKDSEGNDLLIIPPNAVSKDSVVQLGRTSVSTNTDDFGNPIDQYITYGLGIEGDDHLNKAAAFIPPAPLTAINEPVTRADGASHWNTWYGDNLVHSYILLGLSMPKSNRMIYGNDANRLPMTEEFAVQPSREGAKLWSLCGNKESFNASNACHGKPVVLLVHGLISEGHMGQSSYWTGTYPDPNTPGGHILESQGYANVLADQGYAVFMYDWATGIRFEDAAVELKEAIAMINQATGKKVHIVAHSFGGLLARTYIQGLSGNAPYQHDVLSLSTIGTPHTGIFAEPMQVGDYLFPIGESHTGSSGGQLCGQITCHQAGNEQPELVTTKEGGDPIKTASGWVVDNDPGIDMRPYYGASEISGKFIERLVSNLPISVPTQVLIGLYSEPGDTVYRQGDATINQSAQRFHPDLACSAADATVNSSDPTVIDKAKCPDTGLSENPLALSWGNVIEKYLDFPAATLPGQTIYSEQEAQNLGLFNRSGYCHSTHVGVNVCSIYSWEVKMKADETNHPAVLEATAWINAHDNP